MNDLKFAFPQLIKSPGFTAVAVISLALGIGASTAVFSLVDAILLRSLPVPNPRELRVLQWSGADVRMSSFEGSSVQEGNRWTAADCVTHSGRMLGEGEDYSGGMNLNGAAFVYWPVRFDGLHRGAPCR